MRSPPRRNFPVTSASIPNPFDRMSSARQLSAGAILKQVSTSDSHVLKRKLAHQPSALFPSTNQKENAVCAPKERVPYFTRGFREASAERRTLPTVLFAADDAHLVAEEINDRIGALVCGTVVDDDEF